LNNANPENDSQKNRLPILFIAATTIATMLISFHYLSSGSFIVFQNLFYIPIILSCMYYTMRGFIYSICLAIIYFLLILTFTSDSGTILEALIRVALFITIGGIITFLSMQRKRLRKVLQEEREKFQTVADFTYDWVYWTDPKRNLIYVSPSCERISGYKSEEFMADAGLIYRIVRPDDQDLLRRHADEYHNLMTNTAGEVEFRIVNRSNKERWIAHLCQPVYNNEGQFLGRCSSNRDITARKQAEEILLNERKKFLTLSENAPFGMVMIDKKGNFIYINPKFKELFGYDIEDIPDEQAWFKKAYPDPEYRKTVISAWVEDLKQARIGQKRPRIFKVNCKDGTEKIVNFIPVQVDTGENMMSCDDITKQRHFEERLKTMSLTDELTGLYNRRGFFTLSQQQLKLTERTKKNMLFFFVDLDKMKQINDILGHQEGDKALIDIATILKEVFRESDIIGRMGGDEFAVLAIDTSDETREVLIMRLHNTLDDYNRPEGRNYQLSLSIGIAKYDPEKPCSLDELMAQADGLMYEEKRRKQRRAEREE